MRAIHEWLQRQERDGVHGTFLCNWNLTRKQHEQGELLVYVDELSIDPVAYQWGGLVQPGILEVRADMRREGIGRKMVAHRLAEAFELGEDILFIQCTPSSSKPFWKRMGFELLEHEHEPTHAYLVMPRKFDLPQGQPVQVEVQWYPEARKWEKDTPPLSTLTSAAVRTSDGEVCLAERAHCFHRRGIGADVGDVVLRIVVDGVEWYCNKAKYEEAEDLGVGQCRNGFYMDVVYPPEREGK
jgi:GNAT superfamily N-acetyltransferase